MNEKILILRFSSFGDVTQTLSVPAKLREKFPSAKIHWATRAEFLPLISSHPDVSKAWGLEKKMGLIGLIQLGLQLRTEQFTHIYDAHNNLRSNILSFLLKPVPFLGPQLITRSLRRFKRFLLFRFRINQFEMPFNGQRDLIEPLNEWGISSSSPSAPQLYLTPQALNLPFEQFVALAPSAAFFLKRWPKNYWIELIRSMPDQQFILLGGPEDRFIEDIYQLFPGRTHNYAGKLSLTQSAWVIQKSMALVANDTGLLHVAEQLGKPAIALMGPAPFGFPSRSSTTILERNLPCRPCSKHGQGPCINKINQECLTSIQPAEVKEHLMQKIQRLAT